MVFFLFIIPLIGVLWFLNFLVFLQNLHNDNNTHNQKVLGAVLTYIFIFALIFAYFSTL